MHKEVIIKNKVVPLHFNFKNPLKKRLSNAKMRKNNL